MVVDNLCRIQEEHNPANPPINYEVLDDSIVQVGPIHGISIYMVTNKLPWSEYLRNTNFLA